MPVDLAMCELGADLSPMSLSLENIDEAIELHTITNTSSWSARKMLVSLTVGKVDAGVAVLLTEDKRLVRSPRLAFCLPY